MNKFSIVISKKIACISAFTLITECAILNANHLFLLPCFSSPFSTHCRVSSGSGQRDALSLQRASLCYIRVHPRNCIMRKKEFN